MIKRLKWIGIGLAVIVTVVLVSLMIRLDTLVRRQIEMQSTAALNLQTTLAAAHVSIIGESVALKNLQIVSPAGFSAPQMLGLDNAELSLNVRHLRSQPLLIDRIALSGPTLVIEQAGGKFNFQALTEQPSKPPQDGSAPLRLIIRDLFIEKAKVLLRPGIPGLDQEISLALPTITLHDIGTADNNQNGAALKDVLSLLIKSIADEASKSDRVPQQVRALLKLNVNELIDKQVIKLNDQARDAVDKRLGDLLGEKQKKR